MLAVLACLPAGCSDSRMPSDDGGPAAMGDGSLPDGDLDGSDGGTTARRVCSFSIGPCDFDSDSACPELEPEVGTSCSERAACHYCEDGATPSEPVTVYTCLEASDGRFWQTLTESCGGS